MSDNDSRTESATQTPPHRYTAELASGFEEHWRNRWEADGIYRVGNPGDPGFDDSRPKFYCLDMFPIHREPACMSDTPWAT